MPPTARDYWRAGTAFLDVALGVEVVMPEGSVCHGSVVESWQRAVCGVVGPHGRHSAGEQPEPGSRYIPPVAQD